MTVEITSGDLLKQNDVDAIVNTVNCVGVMGKGIALEFKNKWPSNYQAYSLACKAKQVRPGGVFIFDSGGLIKPNFIINFPTKDHWRGKSKLEYIEKGLEDLVLQIDRLGITSIAIPPLGCGNGGLDWSTVKSLILKAFTELPGVKVKLFPPEGAPDPKSMEVKTSRPKMTPGRAAILALLDTYRSLDYGLTKIEIQKLAYFLQEAGQNMKLEFTKDRYGPYSEQLRHALNRMEGHFIRGLGDGVVEADVEPIEQATTEALEFISSHNDEDLLNRIERVKRLIQGFQSPYGMELLASVHWIADKEASTSSDPGVVELVHKWNPRKKELMKTEHIIVALDRLKEDNWIS